MNTIEVNATRFDKAVRFADKAAGEDDRPVLAHLAFEVKGNELSVVGCDGFRLHRAVVPFEGDAQDGQLLYHKQDAMSGIRWYKKDVGLRKKDVVELTMGERGVLIAANCRTSVEWGTGNWGQQDKVYKNVPGGAVWTGEYTEPRCPHYPDYMQIWPRDGTIIEVDKSELVTILKSAISIRREFCKTLGCGRCNPYIMIEVLDDKLRIRLTDTKEPGYIIGSISFSGLLVDTIGINAKYLLDALYGIEGNRVSIRVQDDPGHPLVVGDVAVVMPVHIGRGR